MFERVLAPVAFWSVVALALVAWQVWKAYRREARPPPEEIARTLTPARAGQIADAALSTFAGLGTTATQANAALRSLGDALSESERDEFSLAYALRQRERTTPIHEPEPVFEIRLEDVVDVRIEHRRDALDVTSRFDAGPTYVQGRSEYYVSVEAMQAPAPSVTWRVRLGDWSLVMCSMETTAGIGEAMRTTYQLRASDPPPQSFLDALAASAPRQRSPVSIPRRLNEPPSRSAVTPPPKAPPKAPLPRGARVYDLDEDA